jgi:tyrosine-protein kinase Etk/Wzc
MEGRILGDNLGQEKNEGDDIRKIVDKLRHLWPWMLVGGLLTGALAFVYLYFATPQYKVNAKILIKDRDKRNAPPEASMLENIGLLSGGNNVDNELEILRSYSLMRTVVADLQLNVRYFTRKNIKKRELYGATAPFNLRFDTFFYKGLADGPATYEILPVNKGFKLVDGNGKVFTGKWGATVKLPVGIATVSQNPYLSYEKEKSYQVEIAHPEGVTSEYLNLLSAELSSKQSSAITISMVHETPAKGVQVIDKLIQVYRQSNVDDNNRIADSSMAFIDSRLVVVGDQLTDIEKEIQSFKQKNEISDLSEQARALISSTTSYAKEVAQQEVQLNVIESLERYILDNAGNPRIVPASLVVQDPTLSGVVNQYNNLLMQRSRLLLGSTEDNPVVVNIDAQLKDLRQDLLTGIQSVKRSAQVALRGLRSNSNELEAQMRKVPEKERVGLEYSRQQNIRQELYLFLLQKREETAISRSSTIANSRIIDSARAGSGPVRPKKKIIMALSVFAGLLLPLGIAYSRDMLNTRLSTKRDIETLSSIPIVGEIGHKEGTESVLLSQDVRSIVAEQFRALRTNLAYILPRPEDKVIMVTSGISGEGKSFISTNLAIVLSLTGKKVVLMEMDLRKPMIAKNLNLKTAKGYSHYAIGQAGLDDILAPSGVNDNLFVVRAGPLPPNPAELLLNDRTKLLFERLQEIFDYVIVDTTPTLVSDAQILSSFANATLYVVRMKVTRKEQMRVPNSLYLGNKMPKLNLVVNDITQKKYGGGYYGYGYAYGYGYGYTYGEEEPKKKKRKSTV